MFEGYADVHNVNEIDIYAEIFGDIDEDELGIEGEQHEKCDQYSEIFGELDLEKYVSDLPLSRKQSFKRGDLFVNQSRTGYRMEGCWFIDQETTGEPHGEPQREPFLIDMETDGMDDYGTVPEHFTVISEFPIRYWHDNSTAYMQYCCWHNQYIFYDLSQLGLKLEEQQIAVHNESMYVIFTHQNINYCFFVDMNDMNQKLFLEKLNTPYCLDIEYGADEELAQYLKNTYKVDLKHIMRLAPH
jgi:hypothetical protein